MSFPDEPYNEPVMVGRPPLREAPFFGQRLAALRKSQGLSQRQLAERLGISREMIDYYERRAPNPTFDFLGQAARGLGVSVSELIGEPPPNQRRRPGRVPKLELRFEQIRRLPRKDQELIVQVLDRFLQSAGQ